MIRDKQVEYILFWIETETRETDKVFLMGDLNDQPNSNAYKRILGGGFTSAYSEIHGQEPEYTWRGEE